MMFRLFLVVLFSALCCSCKAEGNRLNLEKSLELSVMSFSSSVSGDNASKFKEVASAQGIYLVRKFTSGNLGGRGAELGRTVSASSISEEMAFSIDGQTPFDLNVLFPSISIKDYKKLSQYAFPAATCGLAFDQWEAPLKKAIAPLPEAVDGRPIVLKSLSECWVYAEAQVIDGILVGGFAVFKNNEDRVSLVSIIEFL